jgi:hypothetical protein
LFTLISQCYLLKRPSAFLFCWKINSLLFQTKYFSNFILEKYIITHYTHIFIVKLNWIDFIFQKIDC